MTDEKRRDLSTSQRAPEEVREEDSHAATERIERMQQEGKGMGGTSTQGRTHPERDESNRERKEREKRDREELGRPPSEARERAFVEDVTERRDREASEQADRIADRGTGVETSEPGKPPHTDADVNLQGGPTEDSPAREPTERVERIEDAEDARSA